MKDFQSGQILLFNKPLHWTSFDVVKKIRNTIRIKKVGHAGTLDPLATGLLIICTGKMTKQISAIQEMEKEYEVVFKLGVTTASYDAETPEEQIKPTDHVTKELVEQALPTFTGTITQIPPIYSAVKIGGKRAYEMARKGNQVELKPRSVNIYEFTLLEWNGPHDIHALVRCSKGTYIRSLIHDLGQFLEVGAYITKLKRTAIGSYSLLDSWEIESFVKEVKDSM